MFNKLIELADSLDEHNHKAAADGVDEIIKNATKPVKTPTNEEIEEWEAEPPTKVDIKPLSVLTPLDPNILRSNPKDSIAIVRDLRVILTSQPNPEDWNNTVKSKVLKLMDKLSQLL